MTIPVLPYIPSMGIKHQLDREIVTSELSDGFHYHKSAEEPYTRSDGTSNLKSYRGLNRFNIGYNKAINGSGKLANNLWTFFMTRLDNLNEPFLFYNPQERSTPDLTGFDPTGRYYVKLANPNQVLNRELFKFCLFSYKLEFIECKEFNNQLLDLTYLPYNIGSDEHSDIGSGLGIISARPSDSLDWLGKEYADIKFSAGGGDIGWLTNIFGYWKMEEAQGYTRLDSSGNGYHLTEQYAGYTGRTDGKLNYCAQFHWDGKYGRLQNYSIPTLPNSNVTVTYWFRINNGSTNDYVNLNWFGGGAITVEIDRLLSMWRIVVTTAGTAEITTGYDYASGSWHFIVIEYDGTTLYLYLDNELVDSDIGTCPFIGSYVDIGANQGTADFLMDEVGIWRRALTSEERAELWNNGSGYCPI